jgi:peptide/nickel transport system substrate-binding protein
MRAISGEIDMQGRHLSPLNYPLLKESSKKGDYRVLMWTTGVGSDPVIHINQNVKDPILKELFRNRDFRIALSLAINRQEINDLCYYGLGKPRQACVISQSPYFDRTMERMYAEYNPDRADHILDKLGLNKRDKDGFRLRPDGKTLGLTIDFTIFPGATTSDVVEMIARYWQAVGIKVAIRTMERSLYTSRTQAGEHEIAIWNLDRCSQVIADPRHFVPYILIAARWCPLYCTWFNSGGKSGEEPPADVKRIMSLWEEVKGEVDKNRRDKLFKEILNIHKNQLYMIGTVGELPQPLVVKNYFRNVPDGFIWDDMLQSPANAYPEQFFIKK